MIDTYCIVSLIGGIHKDQVQLNTLISTSAKGEKTIIKNFSFYLIKYLPLMLLTSNRAGAAGRKFPFFLDSPFLSFW